MGTWFLRVFFLLVSAGAGWQASELIDFDPYWGIILGMAMFVFVLVLEAIFTDKESVANLLAVVFGIGVGILLTDLALNLTRLVYPVDPTQNDPTTKAIRIVLTAMLCYLSTMIIYRTRDRFRFVIPYVEFKKEQRGPRALILDTSALIDGRIAAVCRAGFIETPLFIPDFVLAELHGIADSSDRLKRVRGRRGLDLVSQLQRSKGIDVRIYTTGQQAEGPADSRLVQLARELDAHLCTTDFNLNKVAQAQGIGVLNLNELANALRPSVIPGESLSVRLIRRGEEPKQAVGFLDDGTMVVVGEAEAHIGSEVAIEIVRVLQKSSGRLIFGKLLA